MNMVNQGPRATYVGKKNIYALNRFRHYLFVVCIGLIVLSVLGIINGFLGFIDVSSHTLASESISLNHFLGGYPGIFVLRLLPIPDFIVLPLIGSLSSIGVFNPYFAFLAALGGAIVPFEYLAGRFGARPILIKSLKTNRNAMDGLKEAEKWILQHGTFSIFISTFIPYFYSVVAFAAGTLKVRTVPYFSATVAGFAVRYAILEAAGYYGVYILTPQFDYSHKVDLFILLVTSSIAGTTVEFQNFRKRIKPTNIRA